VPPTGFRQTQPNSAFRGHCRQTVAGRFLPARQAGLQQGSGRDANVEIRSFIYSGCRVHRGLVVRGSPPWMLDAAFAVGDPTAIALA
jgi:hypothetical protein